MRFVFFAPGETLSRWRRPTFGAHWIVWTDGTLWPRHPGPGEQPSLLPPADRPADADWQARLAREAAPVYSHVRGHNTQSVGIEIAHSGRSGDPFPEAQVRTLVWLLETLLSMSEGRLTPASILGHKDLDREPAWTSERCAGARCAFYADAEGTAFRRRVDPPESLFVALRVRGLDVPRERSEGDRQLLRAEAIPAGERPRRVSP
jgi:N-acetyl-anhydromuramyl-L-alanine amidase AmpD